jgi:hypothetical protein
VKLVVIVASALALAVAAGTARAVTDPLEVSSNWSGYALTGATFTNATGTWKQPKARCTPGRATSSSFWVGIGGYGEDAPSLEQLGSVADCDARGRQTYRLWYEVIPAPAQFISLKIAAGDTITAALVVDGQRVVFSMKNVTHGTRFSKTLTIGHPLDTTSAEWIAEAPSLCARAGDCRIVPLTNFGSVGFTNIAAVGDGHPGTITDPLWTLTPLALASTDRFARFEQANPSGALPGAATPDGRAFSVAYRAQLVAPSVPDPFAGGPMPPWSSGAGR